MQMTKTNKQVELCLISSPDALEAIKPLRIDDFLWHCVRKPETTCRIAYSKDHGFILHFRVLESDPRRVYANPEDPVYLDSAVEFFINPDPGSSKRYLNLEMNANGAFLCRYGEDRDHRQAIREITDQRISVRTRIGEEAWEAIAEIPDGVFRDIAGIDGFDRGSRIAFNLYKICETPEDEHYAAFSHIDSPHPDFHLPQFFAEGTIR